MSAAPRAVPTMTSRSGSHSFQELTTVMPALVNSTGISRGQAVAAFGRIACEATLPAQLLERENDLAPVVAADRGHEVLEEFRTILKRGLDTGEARAREAGRLGDFGF